MESTQTIFIKDINQELHELHVSHHASVLNAIIELRKKKQNWTAVIGRQALLF